MRPVSEGGTPIEGERVADSKFPPQPKVPFRTNIKANQRYRWCSCGLSATQPFCDESHRETSFLPVLFKEAQDLTVALCGCKQTKKPPY
ncbi:MAG TPA: CDGSH iron-sulfur domain-containing protein, partial [Beijerinckiaceae bacterium]|nr:CDGSH iron-sulfur domain-containing protein [Beijerinckiaceae bacterium]